MLTETAKYTMPSGIGKFLLRLKVPNVHPSRSCNFVIAPEPFFRGRYGLSAECIPHDLRITKLGLMVLIKLTCIC